MSAAVEPSEELSDGAVGVLAAVVADRFGWRAVHLLAAAATAAALGVVATVVRPQEAAGLKVRYGRLVASLFGLLASEPELRVAALCQALTFASFNAFWLGSTLYLHARFGWGPGAIGAVGLLGAASALCAPLFGRSAQRFGPRRARPVAVFGGGLSSAAVGICWAVEGWTGICWFGAAWGAMSAHAPDARGADDGPARLAGRGAHDRLRDARCAATGCHGD